MDSRTSAQTRRWTYEDTIRFFQRYFGKKYDGGELPPVPFTPDEMLEMRADSYGRGYRAGYLRFLPVLTAGDMDRALSLRNATMLRDKPEFRQLVTRGPSWACFMPVAVKQVSESTLDFLPNLAELMYFFLMEALYLDGWPHGRLVSAPTSTIVDGYRLGIQASFDARLRLDVLFLPEKGPFEGGIMPITFPSPSAVST